MASAWGVDHGEISKSRLYEQNLFRPGVLKPFTKIKRTQKVGRSRSTGTRTAWSEYTVRPNKLGYATGAATAAGATGAGVIAHRRKVSKGRGDWQTIDQRELKARRARRGQRSSAGLASAGAGAALAGYISRPEETHRLTKITGASYNLHAAGHKDLARVSMKGGIRRNPVGVVTLGGAALAGGAAAKWGVNRTQEAHQQREINQRRKRNAGVHKALGSTLGGATRAAATVVKPKVPRTPVKQTMGALPKPPTMSRPTTAPQAAKPQTAFKFQQGGALPKRPGAQASPGGTQEFRFQRQLRPTTAAIGGGFAGIGMGSGMFASQNKRR
jgi:hypothetical protein